MGSGRADGAENGHVGEGVEGAHAFGLRLNEGSGPAAERGSPRVGKASGGGDIGCRYTPEMIEMCEKALELRRAGILKF